MQLKPSLARLLLIAVVAGIVTTSAPAAQRCDALYVVGPELWSTSGLILRDERGIHAPRWSPSGKRVAYVRDFRFDTAQVSELVVANVDSGNILATIPITDKHAFNAVTQLGWRNENTVWTEGHITPSSGIYYEWDVRTGKASRETWGSWFAVAPDGRLAHVGHMPHFAPAERKTPEVMVDDTVVYRAGRVTGGVAWAGDEVVFVDDGKLVSVDPKTRKTRSIDVQDAGSIDTLRVVPGRRTVVIEGANGFIEADLATSKARRVDDVPAGLRTMRIDLATRELTAASAAPGRAVVAEQVRCNDDRNR